MNNLEERGILKLTVRAILEHPYDYEWSTQGLGMYRIYLSDEVRLHLWDQTAKVPSVTEIHDHPWGFESMIVAGELTNYRYMVDPTGANPSARHLMYSDLLLCSTGNLRGDPSPVRLEPWFPNGKGSVYAEGNSYSQRYNEVHRTEAADGTISIIVRRFREEDRDHAYVYWDRGAQFVSAEPRKATHEEVEDVTRRSLQKWFRRKEAA